MRSVPNILTAFRIILVPVFLFLVADGELYWATVVFVTAGATDALDGIIARAFDVKTETGAILDPLADKLLLSSAFLLLTYIGLIPLWLCIPVIFKDLVLLSGFSMFKRAGRTVDIRPSFWGKLTTALQIATIIFAMAISSGGAAFLALAALTAAVTTYTGFDYAWREIKAQTGKQ